MSLPATQRISSNGEINAIKTEIISLEIEMKHALKLLEEAQHRVDSLTKALFDRKSRITLVKRATFDILSMIFEVCAVYDWKSALRISAVCREWRTVIIQVPRAWKFIDQRVCTDECVMLYAERSGRCGLHIKAYDDYELAFSADISDKIYCMEVSKIPDEIKDTSFPILERLCIPRNPATTVDTSLISISHFPSLRHLRVHHSLYGTFNISSFPQLETLGIDIDADGLGINVIRACSTSLKWLNMTVYLYDARLDPVVLNLPQLSYLRIEDEDQETSYWLELSAPNLSTYIGEYYAETYTGTLHGVIGSITHLRLYGPPPVTSRLKHLRVIQFDGYFGELRDFICELVTQKPTWSHLEKIEFRTIMIEGFPMMADAILLINSFNMSNELQPPCSILFNEDWCLEFPGDDEDECGRHLPCSSWK